VLGTEVLIRAANRSLAGYAREIAVGAAGAFPPTGRVNIDLLEADGLIQVHQGGSLVYQDREIGAVLLQLESTVTEFVARAMEGYTRLHAGSVTLEGRRFLVAGSKGAGKSSLLLKLLIGGAEVQGDENVLFRGEETIPLPRKFHLRDGTLEMVPELKAAAAGLRRYQPVSVPPLCFFDPTDVGLPWRVKAAPADAIVFLEPAFGGDSILEPFPKVGMVQDLLFQTLNLAEKAGPQIEELSGLVRGCACFRLRNGNLEQAAAALRTAAGRL
jgi:hypothetical protein